MKKIHERLQNKTFRAILLFPQLTVCIILLMFIMVHAACNFSWDIPIYVIAFYITMCILLISTSSIMLWSDNVTSKNELKQKYGKEREI